MSIVSSTYVEATPLPDGPRAVTETHTGHLGLTYTVGWIGTADAAAKLIEHAAELEVLLAEQEADSILGGA